MIDPPFLLIYTWTSGDDDLTPVPLAPGELAAIMWAGDGEDTGYTFAKPFITTVTGDAFVSHDGYLPLGSLFVGLTSMTGNGTYSFAASSGTKYIEVIVGALGQELFKAGPVPHQGSREPGSGRRAARRRPNLHTMGRLERAPGDRARSGRVGDVPVGRV